MKGEEVYNVHASGERRWAIIRTNVHGGGRRFKDPGKVFEARNVIVYTNLIFNIDEMYITSLDNLVDYSSRSLKINYVRKLKDRYLNNKKYYELNIKNSQLIFKNKEKQKMKLKTINKNNEMLINQNPINQNNSISYINLMNQNNSNSINQNYSNFKNYKFQKIKII